MEQSKYVNYKHDADTLKTASKIDDKKIVAEHWWLKPQMVAYSCPVNVMGQEYPSTDFKSVGRDLLIVGTKRANYLFFCKMLDLDAWQIKDSWDYEMTEELLERFKNNGSDILCMEMR